MRLLNVDTFEFREFNPDNIPPYLVTSHRWSTDEVTYKDVVKRRKQESEGYRKVENFCAFARRLKSSARGTRDSINWIWIDTCCINQSSSSEVSESINSMWTWYSQATHCIAYLRDVRPLRAGWEAVMFDFRNSEWFERGWTLQELLAPPCVIFLTQEWEVIGRKSPPSNHRCSVTSKTLETSIAEVTSIPENVLCTFETHRDALPREVKMAWAANRRTTKLEDAAYCLLGIFDVHMPLIYGEGERNARKRLEQEIAKREQELNELQSTFAPGFAQGGVTDTRTPLVAGVVPSSASSLKGPELTPSNIQSSLRPQDRCSICQLLLLDPLSTTCGHTFCESCLVPDGSTDLTIAPLNAEGQAEGEAATDNFKALTKCLICDTVDMDSLIALPNLSLAQKLRYRYPQMYAQREAELDETNDPGARKITIFIGNWHRELKAHHHDWSFFVKPSRTDIVKEVQINLHESFPEPQVVCPRPPYVFHGQGWGYFTIEVLVVLQAGYSWMSSKSSNLTPGGALKLQWTLDFNSFGGRGAMGKCRVKVRKDGSVR